MQIDWTLGLPPTYTDVEVFVRGHVRKGVYDGVHFHISDNWHPSSNAICDASDLEAWKYTPCDNAKAKSLIDQQRQMMGWANSQPYSTSLAASVSAILGLF